MTAKWAAVNEIIIYISVLYMVNSRKSGPIQAKFDNVSISRKTCPYLRYACPYIGKFDI